MAENKTVPTDASVSAFLAAVEPEKRRRQGQDLLVLMNDATGMKPQMWGSAIVGYGRYRYRYDSGRTGEFLITGFSPRKSTLAVYIMPGFDAYSDQLARLGKHKHSVSCLYITDLDKIDRDALTEIVSDSVARMKERYPDWSPA